MASEATFYKLAGCVWLSEFGSSFTEINENCKEGGGQLITLEHFQNETDSLNLVTSIGIYPFHISLLVILRVSKNYQLNIYFLLLFLIFPIFISVTLYVIIFRL